MNTVVIGGLYRHCKTGSTYVVITTGRIEKDLSKAVVYGAYDPVLLGVTSNPNHIWIRPLDEFCDGRFEEV